MSCQGCGDTALPLANCNDGCADCQPTHAIGLPPCAPGSEPCEEVAYSECLKYTGPDLPALGIANGMRLKTALAAMNYKLTTNRVYRNYTITVSNTQTTTVVEYIDNTGVLQSKTVTAAASPQTICALELTPTKMSGTGVLAVTNTTC